MLRASWALLWVSLLVMAIVIGIGFVVQATVKREKNKILIQQAEAQASTWRSTLESHILKTVSTADTVAGFIAGGAKKVPPHNGTLAERRAELIAPEAFTNFASNLFAHHPGLLSLQIQPSAVINQVYPPKSAILGMDLFQSENQKVDVYNAIKKAGTIVAGPMNLVQGGIGLIARSPVFLGAEKSFETWWGNGVVVVLLERFVNGTGIQALTSEGYDYQLEYINQNNMQLQIIVNSTSNFNKAKAVNTTVRLPNGFVWQLYIGIQQEYEDRIHTTDIILIVGCGFTSALLTACLWLGMTYCIRRSQRNIARAPTVPPFTLVFTDIESSTELWSLYPEAMAQAMLIHNRIIRQHVRSFKAYEVKTVGDSFMIASKDPQAALELCIAVQRDLHYEKSWPQEIELFYGTGIPYLKVRMGIHFCASAECIFDDVSKGYDYIGPDVNRCARIESAARGGEILISPEMAEQAAKFGSYRVEVAGEYELKGFVGLHVLHRMMVNCPPDKLYAPRADASVGPPTTRSMISTNTLARMESEAAEENAIKLVEEFAKVNGDDLDVQKLRQQVVHNLHMLTTLVQNLPPAAKGDVVEKLCNSWSIQRPKESGLANLALRMAQVTSPSGPIIRTPKHSTLSPQPSRERLPLAMGQSTLAQFHRQSKPTLLPSPSMPSIPT